jgi:hypothetical protein
VKCYDPAGASVDHGFSVLQVAGARTGRRLGFAFADQQATASYVDGPASSFNSSGGSIIAERSFVGRYTVTFVGLQKQPGHSEIVPVADIVAELPCLVEELATGRIAVDPLRVLLSDVEKTWNALVPAGRRVVLVP